MSRREHDVIYVELPASPDFSQPPRSAPRLLRAVSDAETDYVNANADSNEEEEEEDGVTVLPDINPFNMTRRDQQPDARRASHRREEEVAPVSRPIRQAGRNAQALGRPQARDYAPNRRTARVRHAESGEEDVGQPLAVPQTRRSNSLAVPSQTMSSRPRNRTEIEDHSGDEAEGLGFGLRTGRPPSRRTLDQLVPPRPSVTGRPPPPITDTTPSDDEDQTDGSPSPVLVGSRDHLPTQSSSNGPTRVSLRAAGSGVMLANFSQDKGKQKHETPSADDAATRAGNSKQKVGARTLHPGRPSGEHTRYTGRSGAHYGSELRDSYPFYPYYPYDYVDHGYLTSGASSFESDSEPDSGLECHCPRGQHHRECRYYHHSRHHHHRHNRHLHHNHHYHRGYHGHHGRPPLPPWWPHPFPMTVGNKLSPFGQPIYANVPELPSVLDQCRGSFYTLPVPPVTMLRDLQREHSRQVPKATPPPLQAIPSNLGRFEQALSYVKANSEDLLQVLPALAYHELHPYYVDQVFDTLQTMVQVRFAERKGDKVVNRVHVVQRYALAHNAVARHRPELDVDLVLPGDFVLRRWAIEPDTPEDQGPITLHAALGLTPTRIARGEISIDKLQPVLTAIKKQLSGGADGFIFPGEATEANKYVGSLEFLDPQPADRILARSVGMNDPVMLNIHVKAAVRVNGQDMVVGVDAASAVSEDHYQMHKLYRTPNAPLGELPLGPIERSALVALGLWKSDIGHGDFSKYASRVEVNPAHFSIALAALHELDVDNPLYISKAAARMPLTVDGVIMVMIKVATYLLLAYSSSPLVAASTNGKATSADQARGSAMQCLLPLSSCGTLEALYTQVAGDATNLPGLVKAFEGLASYLESLAMPNTPAPRSAANGTGANLPSGSKTTPPSTEKQDPPSNMDKPVASASGVAKGAITPPVGPTAQTTGAEK